MLSKDTWPTLLKYKMEKIGIEKSGHTANLTMTTTPTTKLHLRRRRKISPMFSFRSDADPCHD